MLGEEFAHLGLDRLGQQGARSVAQHLGERVGERPWLKQLDDVSIGHGVSLLCWRSGGLNTPTIRRLHPVSPSPTFAHSSGRRVGYFCGGAFDGGPSAALLSAIIFFGPPVALAGESRAPCSP